MAINTETANREIHHLTVLDLPPVSSTELFSGPGITAFTLTLQSNIIGSGPGRNGFVRLSG
jgi:hypothetical protein